MYIRKICDKVLIEFVDDELSVREIRLLNSIVSGNYNGEVVKFNYTLDGFKDLMNLIIQKSYYFKFDNESKLVWESIQDEAENFKEFSSNALAIKNNLSDTTGAMFADFIRVIDSNMKRNLYDFQSRAAFHMAYSVNSCNFSVPGTGKTSIVYGAYTYLKHTRIIDKILIVGPLSSFAPWRDEFFECFGTEPDIRNLSDNDKNEKCQYLNTHSTLQQEITFINYEGFMGIVSDMQNFIVNNEVMVVLDEAHKIKNPTSLRAKAVLDFSKNAKSRVILTGTPLPNGYIDLYNLFEFIWPGRNVIGFNPNALNQIMKARNYKTLVKKLMDNIDPYYIRIKKEHLGLPFPVFHKPIKVDLGVIQSDIYEFIAKDFLEYEPKLDDYELQSELKKGKLVRLMQAITNPGSINIRGDNFLGIQKGDMYYNIKNYNLIELPPKFEATFKLVNEIISRGEKVIIWTIYTYNIIYLQKYLESFGYQTELLYGNVDNNQRVEIIEKFHKDDNLRIIIANPAAVAESISLHKVCNNAIYLDKSFNAAHYMQSKDRIHRVGLNPDTRVNYYFILSRDTIDEVIHNRVLKKESVMLEVIEGNEVPLFDQDFGSDMSDIDIEIVKEYLGGKFR